MSVEASASQIFLYANEHLLERPIARAVCAAIKARAEQPLRHIAHSLLKEAGDENAGELERLREETARLKAELARMRTEASGAELAPVRTKTSGPVWENSGGPLWENSRKSRSSMKTENNRGAKG